jgi:hypothetical protein
MKSTNITPVDVNPPNPPTPPATTPIVQSSFLLPNPNEAISFHAAFGYRFSV